MDVLELIHKDIYGLFLTNSWNKKMYVKFTNDYFLFNEKS